MIDEPNRLALVIEDNEDLNEILSHALEEAGFSVVSVLNGQQAFSQLEKVTPALIILDLHLPHLSGEEILKQIRATDRFRQTLIIIATADPEWGQDLQDYVTLVLNKPIRYSQIRDLAGRLRFI